MYSLVIVFMVGIITRWSKTLILAFPLLVAGVIISTYHYVLQMNAQTPELLQCAPQASCRVADFNYFHFITPPLLALAGFIVIAVIVFWPATKFGSVVYRNLG